MFSPVMKPALRNLNERTCGPVGIAINGVCEMHILILSFNHGRNIILSVSII